MKKQTTLQNGLTVITHHEPSNNSTMLAFWVKAGSDNEKNYPYGIAHFLEHCMFNGTKTRTKDQINEAIVEVGGSFNASTSTIRTNYYTIMPHTQWRKGITILADMMFHSNFPEDEIQKEKKVVLEEIKRAQDDPVGYGGRVMVEHMMKHYPERQSTLGTSESVSSITREDLLSFMDTYYQPQNMVFVATGNINHEEVCALLETVTPTTSKEVVSSVEPYKPIAFNGEVVQITRDISQTHLRFGLVGPDVYHEDTKVMEIIGDLLGGNMSSRLFKKVRNERGLAYSVAAMYAPFIDYGRFTIYVGTSNEKVEEAKSVIMEELERLKTEAVSEQELTKVKNYAIGQYLISLDSKQVINSDIAMGHLFGVTETREEYEEKINKVTPEDIMRVAKTYFTKENLLIVEVGANQDK